ncbi:SipW-dependent-type signal peptide-containing protein [Nocardioides massiliensis]|nr:SipW-dependent-type signal peptide-containing protein [Nocardioides massiliensis]
MILGVLAGTGVAGAWAYWTDTATVRSGPIRAGSMDLRVNGEAVGTGTSVTVAAIATNDLTPGEAQAFALTISNVGTPDLKWTATATRAATPAWGYSGDPLLVTLHRGAPVDDASYPRVDSCTHPAMGSVVAVTAGSSLLTAGPQLLTAGQSEVVCVLIAMDDTAGNANQGASGAVALTFDAVQVTP